MKTLNFRLNHFALTVLVMPLFVACTPSPAQEAVKNYTAISCAPLSGSSLERNVATLASTYFMFRGIALPPHDVELHLNSFYATGTSQIDNQIFDIPTRERLGFNDINEAGFVKIASVLKMPTMDTQEKKQTLQFSDSCQINSAVAENVELSREPQGVFYLLASRKSFIVIGEGTYKPEPSLPVKFKLLNPRTQETEEATIALQQIIGGDYYSAPMSLTEQLTNKVQNLFKKEDTGNNSQWSINKQIKVPYSPDHPYFTVTKQSEGETIVGEILSVQFAPEETK